MGRSASSSKRKSSKPRSSKLSHQAKQRKKSRRNKSKKRLHRDDLSYSNDDSMSSVSSSSSEDSYLSSSEDEYKSRKGRLRARDAKNRKKKSRQKYYSPDGSKDPPRTKKRKRSKKDVYSRSKKKWRKTKRRRDASISSRSGGSHSCSTCQSESSSGSEENKPGRHSRKSRETKRYKRDPRNSINKGRKSRSPSCSSFSRYSHRSCSLSPGPEKVAAESKSVRLRSVISVVEHQQEEDSRKSDKEFYKEEIIYDRDDYPSSRSNDSPDRVTKRESTYFSHLASGKTKQERSAKGEEVTLSNVSTKDLIEASAAHSGQVTSPGNQGATEISIKVGGSGNENIELILRQKALENLKKFRERNQITSMTCGGPENMKNANNDPLVTKTAVHEKALKMDASNEHSPATDVVENSTPAVQKISHAETERVVSGGGTTRDYPEVKIEKDIHPSLSGNSNKDKNTSEYAADEKSGLGGSALLQALGTCSAVKEETAVQEPLNPNLSEKVTGTAAALSSLTPNNNDNGAARIGVVNTSSSTSEKPTTSNAGSSSLDPNSTEQRDGSKDGLQFEEKSMSVMRGGEMVQVTYKVYIPKKAPALARRRLKR